jgi:2-polyprenyl-3-methyl-5-hydroxy-6-metoxy-1,4-benzoquinol methylase
MVPETVNAPEPQAAAGAETADIETSSDGYAARFAGPTGAWMLAVQERIVRRLLAADPPAEILDVGGGHGQIALPLAAAGYAVTVLGSDDSCRRRIAELVDAGRCRFLTGSVVALPLPDRSFDAVLCFRLLPHCARWPALIGELCRVARRAVIVDYPTRRSLNRVAPAFFGAKKRIEGNTRAWTLFRDREIRAEFARHGFAPRRRCPEFFLPLVLHRALRCRPLSSAAEAACRTLGLTALWGSPVIAEMAKYGGVP